MKKRKKDIQPSLDGAVSDAPQFDVQSENRADLTCGRGESCASVTEVHIGKGSEGSQNKRYAKASSPKGVEYVPIETDKSEVVEKEKMSLLGKLSAVWTLISTAYAIVSTCLFVSRDWVTSTASYILIGILSVYILAFIGLIVLVVRNPKTGTKAAKYYKTILKIYKAFINVVFLILTAVSMAGMAAGGMSVGKWFVFVLTFIVAFVQLGFKIAMLVFKLMRRNIAKKFKVEIENFKDGKKSENTLLDKIKARRYRDKD